MTQDLNLTIIDRDTEINGLKFDVDVAYRKIGVLEEDIHSMAKELQDQEDDTAVLNATADHRITERDSVISGLIGEIAQLTSELEGCYHTLTTQENELWNASNMR